MPETKRTLADDVKQWAAEGYKFRVMKDEFGDAGECVVAHDHGRGLTSPVGEKMPRNVAVLLAATLNDLIQRATVVCPAPPTPTE